MASFRSSVQHVAAATLLAIALLCKASAGSPSPSPPLPFPCGTVPPCVDDPTFEFSGLACNSSVFDTGCLPSFPEILEACILTCLSCEICEDPDPIPGFDTIIQFDEVETGVLIVYIDITDGLLAADGTVGCLSAGLPVRVNITEAEIIKGPSVGNFNILNSPVSGALDGDFIIANLGANNLLPGYYQLVSFRVDTQTSSFSQCDAGTLGILNFTANINGSAVSSVCGTYEDPCPGFGPSPSPPPPTPPSPPSPPPPTPPSPPPVSQIPGDVDLDGDVDISDVVLLIAAVNGSGDPLTGAAFTNADLNSDGVIGVEDIVLIIALTT